MAKNNLVKGGVVVASTSNQEVAPSVPSVETPVVETVAADVPSDAPVVLPAPVASNLVVTLDRTWPDGAGAYVIDGIVGKIYVKPGFFNGPPPATLTLVGLNLIAQPTPIVRKPKVGDAEKAAKLLAKAAELEAKAAALRGPAVNPFEGLIDDSASVA